MRGIPTINDLRVKLCFICRDEEVFDKPSEPSKRWIHPCKCTLVAHEDCLLEWIRIAEKNPDQKTASLRRCPQCKEKYIIISDYPFGLGILDNIRLLAATSGQIILICTVAAACTSAVAGVYLCCTGYGSYAIEKFIGHEMFDILIGDDPEKWPGLAFLNFPLVPISLVVGRTMRFRNMLPLSHLLGWWPAVTPQNTTGPSMWGFILNMQTMTRHLPRIRGPAETGQILGDAIHDAIFSWPPSPAMVNVGSRVVPGLYNRLFAAIRKLVLGDAQDETDIDDSPLLEININEEHEEEEEEEEEEAVAAVQAQAEQAQIRDENDVRLELDGAGGVAAVIDAQGDRPDNAAPAANGQPNANANNQAERNGGRGVRLRMTALRMGMVFGGALVIPTIASVAGSVLLRLALPSYPGSHATLNFSGYSPLHPKRMLCSFLGVKPPGSAVRQSVTDLYTLRSNMGPLESLRVILALSTRALIVGTPAWTSADPVWWRNTVGFCMVIAAKDVLGLYYQYSSRKEILSRRVKSLPFDGIDPKELDLKPFNLYDVDD